MENEIGVMAAPKAATDEEIGAMPMIRIEGMEEPQGMGAFQSKARARAFDLAAAKRADDESEEAFAGMPTDELRSRLEYVRLESRARMMMDNADSFGDEEFGSVFRELNKRRFIADDRSLAAFDALDGEGKVTNRSRLADFLAFSDRLSAAKTADEQQSLLGDKFASPALKAWREAKDNGASVAYARRKLEEEGRSWGDVGASLLENAKRLFGVKPGDEDAAKREAETAKLEDGSLLGQARKAVGDEARMWRKVGASVANPEFEWLSDRRAVAEYEKKLLGDELRAEAAKVMPFLTKAQRDLVNVYAAGGEVAQGVFKLMKPEDREMMYSMCQAVRPAADLNWLSEMAARVGMGVRSAWRGARRADVGATDWIMNKGGEFLLGKSNLWSTPEEREAIRRDMLDDIHWAQSVHDLKLKDPEGFLDKALAGYADSASMQYSMLGGALARSWAKPLAGTRTGAALAVGGLALESYAALAMIGEQFDNMLMHGIEIDKAGPLAVCGGLVDTYVESMNLKDWFGKSLAPAEMKRVGVRAALRAALKMDGKEFMRVLRTNAKQAFKIAGSEVREELLQGMNQQGWCSLAEGKDALDAFTSSEAFQAGAEAFWEALPACTAFGVFGAANVTGSVAKGANGAYAEHLQEVSRIVARKNGVGELDRKGEAAAWRLAQNEAARVAEATKGMTRRERNEWINAQEDLTLAEKQFYAEHCDMYEASVAQDGREWADAHLSGSIDEAMFAKAGWRFEHDEKGWVTGVTTANGERFDVDFRNREATLDDLSDADKAALVEAWNREAADGEKLGGVDDPRLADVARQVNGFYSNGRIVLFGARATGATLGHEATHGMIDALSKIAGRQARRTVKALAGHLGGKVEGGKLDVGADEAAANRVEDIVFAREVANMDVAPERVDVRALGKNLVTALRKAVGLGKGRVFLPVVRTAEGVEANPEECLHDLVAESLAALAQREANEAARKKEVAEARARHKAEREEKRQRKIELRRAERQGAAREQWESAEQKAKDEEDFWKGVDAEIAAEEQKEIDAINARHDAEARLLAEEAAKVERAREAEAERQRKMSEKMLENRRNAVKTMPKFHAPKGTDEVAAKRITAAYGAAWRAKSGKFITQADVDMLAEVYGLPPEALNLKRMGGGYRLVKEQLLSDASLARFEEGLERFYDDILGVEIEVPDVVVGSVEEAANAVPNEVWDPVSETFIEGRVVVDAANAKSFREQAGLKDEDAPTVTPAEIVKSREGAAVEEDAAPKDGEETIVEKMTERAPVEELPIDEVHNDDTRIPNFKEGANPETGVVEPLMGEPYDLVANPIVVMEFKDGKKVVVTGRHRLDLYRRAGRRTIAARVIREADGWTVKDAQAIDAMANIIDEKGTVKDYVRFFENVKPTRADAEAGGWLARQKGRDAYGIYEGATPDTRAAIDWEATGNDGLISVAQAATISQVAPRGAEKRNAALQRVLVARALKGVTGRKLAILGRTLVEEAKRIPADAGSGGGATQLDLFASAEDQSLLKAMERQAEYRSRRANEYYRIAQVLRTAMQKGGKLELNAAYAKELGIKKRSSREDLAKARDLAVEKQLYWENAVQLEDADKAEMDRALAEEGKGAKRFSVGDRRALRPADVFDTGAGDGVEIPVASLRTYKDESGESVLNAARFMSEAADGRGAKRKPLLVADNGDGTYTVVDGTATSKALAAAGAGTAYAKVVGPNLGTRLANSAYAVESVKPEGGVLRAGNAATLDEAIAQAADNADALAALCRAAAEKVGGEVKPRKTNPETGKPTKRRASAERKLRDEYAGDVSRLVDLVGGTVVIDDDGDFGDALKAVERSLPDGASIVRVKKLNLGAGCKGYGDVKVNVRFANGGVGEVILVGRGMFEGKELRGGHEVYNIRRILGKYKGQSPEIDEACDALDKLTDAVYAAGATVPDEASFASIKARASSSITRLIPGPYANLALSSADATTVKSLSSGLNRTTPASFSSNAAPALSLMKNMDASLVDAVRETISRPTADSIAYSGVGAQGGETRFSISHLYTGSAADYEKPSLHAVGTGEGSQVYGWGLYASNVRGVADRYANNGSRFEHNGKTMPIYIDDNTAQGLAESMLRGCSGHVDKTINILKRDQRRYQERGLSDEKIVKAIEYLRNHGNEYKFTRGVPHVYEQTFFTNRAPGDESHLLNWYEMDNLMPGNALHEQVKWIRRQAKKEGVKLPRDLGSYGSDVYETLVGALGSPKAASEFLARADIDGVKYPVDSYKGGVVKDGDKVGWNYVSFRDDNISVDHKWVNGETRFSMRVNPNLRREVDEVVVGRRADGTKVGRHGRVVFSSMPDILKWLGLPDLEIETDRARIAKIVAKHHLTTEQIADLPNRYDKPASVFRDGANAYVVLTDMIGKTDSGADKPVMVRLTRKDGRKGETVFVASAYPREIDKEVEYVRLANTPGAALFVDKDKVATLGLEEGTTSTLCTLADRDDVMTPGDFSSFVTARIVSQNGVGAQGGESVRVEVEGDGIVEKVKRLARPAAVPGADAPRFSIGDRSAANVAKFYLAREIMENRGRMPDMRRAANVARSLGYGGSLAELVRSAQTEAAQQTQLLRYLASDPKTEKVLADAGLALRNERAVERARAAAIQFSREVGEAAEGTKRATERAVRRMKGEDYERMVVREGLDLDAILRAIRPEERAAPKDGEKGEGDGAAETPAALTDADRALIAQKAAEAIANGAEAVARAKELVKAKEDADAAKAQDGAKDAGGAADADEDGEGDGADDAHEGAIAKAIRETVAKAGFTLDSPEAMVQLVKAITEKYVRDFPGEFANLDADDPWSSPLVRAKFAANLASFAQSVADAYAPSYARVRVAGRAQMLNDQGLTTVRQIEEAGEALFRDLHADVIRQSRSALIRDIRKLVKPHAKHYAENELKKDRQVDAALGRYCKFAYRVMGYSAKKCEERAAQLEQELAGWAGVEDADRDRIREFADRKMELEMIDMFGNLRARMPAELADLRDFVEQTINESRWEAMQFGEKWEAARHEAAQKAAGGIVGDPKRGGVKPEAVETSGLYSLIGMLETKARQLTRWATGQAREDSLKAFGAVEEMIQGAEDRQFNYMQGEKAKFVDLCATVYGDHVKAGRALTAEIDRSLWDSLDRGGQKTAWTVGRVMQMYVSCVQSDYADNCAKWGRDAAYVRHLEDVLNALDPRHMDFVEGLRGIYREQGAALDEVMRRTTGTTLLTPNRLYMPVKMFRDDNIAQKARARAYSPFAPSLTPRVRNGLDFRQDVDIVDMWQERMADAAHTIGWADAGSMVQGVLQSDSVLRAIRDAHGDKVLGQWQRYVLDILAGAEQGKVDSSNWGVAAMRFCARLASRTWLALNPASWAKQLGAVPCFALSGDGDLRSVAKSVSFVALRPFEAAKVMRDLAGTAAFQARYGVAISQEMKYATSGEGQFRNWISRIMDWSMKGIMGFDKLGVYALAGVYHQKRCELETQGKGAEEASELASSWLMHIVDKTAQTTRTVNTTELQRAGGAWGILLQFKSAPAQQTQFEITAIQDALAHPEDAKRWKKAAVCVLVNHVIVPTINTAIESVVACLTSWGAPDEEKRRRLVEMWIANIVSGSLGSVVFIGTVAEGVGSLLGKVASGGDVNMYDLRNSLGRQIPAAEMLNLWVNQGDKAIKALLEVGDGDIAEGVEDMAFALGAVVPGLSWISRKGKQALDSAREK